ncbi:hypothetical protein K1T35_19570 [Pseudonocardia sp. DSM 110487]|uniref:hypothetical protein n=1 Tax=Pseudonocardia sp. DSM 110487 TaxID=2865833 RepID=UPI001C6A0C3F|nr:hypothetical protein [Pseudonocardia sp. DSM 110487]QYN39200.1 hypothetical protein K1T35_19570 [Pseudonocardia sp. DSM 110487]
MAVPASARNRSAPQLGAAVLAPIGFLGAFLAVGPVSGAFADRPLPMPDAPVSEVAAYYAANPLSIMLTAGLQVLSVACLAVFVGFLAPALRAVGAAWLPRVGYLSVAAMVVSSALSVTLVMLVTSVTDAAVVALRQANFYAGGVVAVVTLGVFVLGSAMLLGRERLFGAPTRWFGLVAGGIAVLSVLSLVIYPASIALPAGRVLSMVWTIVAGVGVYRRLT